MFLMLSSEGHTHRNGSCLCARGMLLMQAWWVWPAELVAPGLGAQKYQCSHRCSQWKIIVPVLCSTRFDKMELLFEVSSSKFHNYLHLILYTTLQESKEF